MAIRVNGEEVAEEAVRFEYDRLVKFYSGHMSAEQIRRQADVLRRRARDQAVGAKLLIMEARRLDLAVPGGEVEGRLRAMVGKAGGEEAFDAVLRRQGLTRDGVRRSIEEGRRVDLLVERITAGVPDPTEEEMRRHFEEHRAEYRKPDRARTQHILIRPETDTERDRGVACSRLAEIIRRVEEGADFAEQAAAHSQCPSGRKTGGSLGWISRGMMLPEFDRAVFSLAAGQMSGIVETPLGYHVIRNTAREDGGPAEFEDVREAIRELLRHARRGEAIAALVAELREKAVVEGD
jgi:parvulin-like peptidyl-prolyl isomerase